MIVGVVSVLSARKRFIGKLSKTNWIRTSVRRVPLSFIDFWVTNSFKIHTHIQINIKRITRLLWLGVRSLCCGLYLALWWRHSARGRHYASKYLNFWSWDRYLYRWRLITSPRSRCKSCLVALNIKLSKFSRKLDKCYLARVTILALSASKKGFNNCWRPGFAFLWLEISTIEAVKGARWLSKKGGNKCNRETTNGVPRWVYNTCFINGRFST